MSGASPEGEYIAGADPTREIEADHANVGHEGGAVKKKIWLRGAVLELLLPEVVRVFDAGI
jgi:hypothetical protein